VPFFFGHLRDDRSYNARLCTVRFFLGNLLRSSHIVEKKERRSSFIEF
jgi:hypothetical protein